MPTQEESARGGVVKYRTLKLRDGRYIRVAIVRRRGKRGGHTVAGQPHTRKV